MSTLERPLFFTVRKNRSYFSWAPSDSFFSFGKVCIDVVSDAEFAVREGECMKVYRFGHKLYASATRFRMLRDGIYILAEEKDGRYVFRLIRPLQEKT